MLAFRTSVANRVREARAAGKPEGDIVLAVANEQRAIAQAISTADFSCKMTHAYLQEMAALQAPIAHDDAQREVNSIIKNRIEDCKNFVALLDHPAFLTAMRAEASQPAKPKTEYKLSTRKIEEVIRRFVQPNDPAGAEPAVHVAMTARGHQVGHMALANMFRPKAGSLRAPLVDALATAWPQASGEQIQQLAQTWLKARHDPAHSIADALKPEGDIYREAMRRAELLQNQKLGIATTSAPATQTTAPRIHAGVVQAKPELAVDAL
jgi:hypothetical protein